MSFSSKKYQELKALLAADSRATDLLDQLMNEHQYTLSKISHEIRNPLTLVSSTLQLIQDQHPEVHTFKYWNDLQNDMHYMTDLLQELSAFNNSEKLHLSSVSSCDFLRKICISFAISCQDSDIEFSSTVPDLLPVILIDPIKIQEVILNLLRNAKDAISSSGSIHLDAFCDEKNLVIRITDNGCGIPSDHIEDIFDAFTTYKSNGTGLGLAIARRTIEAHSGKIFVNSTQGEGSSFWILLPLS